MKKLILLSMLLGPISCFADQTVPKATVEAFFSTLQRGKIDSAFNQLAKGSPITTEKPAEFDYLKKQARLAINTYGKLIGPDFVREENFGTCLVRLTYILKSENGPTAWEFYFYKPKTDWYLESIRFDDKLTALNPGR